MPKYVTLEWEEYQKLKEISELKTIQNIYARLYGFLEIEDVDKSICDRIMKFARADMELCSETFGTYK